MKLIEQNPFRVLGISVNASPKDLAANKGKMRLLDIGKEVAFSLDMSGMLHPIVRTKESVAVAERDINLPHDRVRHALFWFAQPDSPLGKLAYDHLLQGMTDSAIEKFNRCPKWEAKLCLATLYLQRGDTLRALNAISYVIDKHCVEFVQAVAGQTHSEDADALRHDYVMSIAQEVDIAAILAQTSDGDLSEAILAELRSVAVDKPMASIEKAIATAKSVDNKDAAAQLKAGRDLMNSTKAPCQQLARLVGKSDMRYSRLADKLANQILQCSINYFNNIEGENREIIENALALGEYALTVAVGKMARDHVQHNVDILRKKKADLPPAEVEEHDNAIKGAIVMSILKGRTIDNAIQLMKDCAPHIVAIKEMVKVKTSLKQYYLHISTQVVNTVLSIVIEEHNEVHEKIADKIQNPYTREDAINELKAMLRKAWKATLMMDKFEMESDFFNNRYSENRNSLKEGCESVLGRFGFPSIGTNDIDLRTEDEIYNGCRTLGDYQRYINRFSNGKHIIEARRKYNQLSEEEQKKKAEAERKRQEKEERERKEAIERKRKEENERMERIGKWVSVGIGALICIIGWSGNNDWGGWGILVAFIGIGISSVMFND